MQGFVFNTTASLLSRPGALSQLSAECHSRGVQRPLIVTDSGILKLGLLQRVIDPLQAAGLAPAAFTEVVADPPESTVLAALAVARSSHCDGVIGFGGGSSMDTAKLVALLARSGESLADIYGVGNVRGERLPLILIPTTAGTGSEVTPIAIVTTGETTKTGVVAPQLLPDLALLDAELTLGLPPGITAATGIDAMVHAIEAYTSAKLKNPYSDMLAKESLTLMHRALPRAVADGGDLQARQDMLLGACLAGQAFANAPVGAVHALAYPLGGHFHIPHGLSNALVLIDVLEFNAPVAAALYAELAPLLGSSRDSADSVDVACANFIAAMQSLLQAMPLPQNLAEAGVPDSALELLADDAMLQQRLLVNNPRPVQRQDALAIYRAAYG